MLNLDQNQEEKLLENVRLPNNQHNETPDLLAIQMKLDKLLELQEKKLTDFRLEEEEFKLKHSQSLQEMQYKRLDFNTTTFYKFIYSLIGLTFTFYFLYQLIDVLFNKIFHNLFLIEIIKNNPNILMVIILSCMVSIFGLIVIILKMILGKDKNETPLPIEQIVKSIIDSVKIISK